MPQDKQNKIRFTAEGTNEVVELFVLEQAKLNGVNYILVSENQLEDDNTEAMIFKETNQEGTEIIYDIVTDDNELEIVGKLFEEILEDFDIEA